MRESRGAVAEGISWIVFKLIAIRRDFSKAPIICLIVPLPLKQSVPWKPPHWPFIKQLMSMKLNPCYKGRHCPLHTFRGTKGHGQGRPSVGEMWPRNQIGILPLSHPLVLVLFPIQIPNPDCCTCSNKHRSIPCGPYANFPFKSLIHFCDIYYTLKVSSFSYWFHCSALTRHSHIFQRSGYVSPFWL